MKALATNKLASSPHYQRILSEYNEEFGRSGGKVNNSKFYREKILPVIPTYHQQSWYQFLHRFKSTAGLMAVQVVNQSPNSLIKEEEGKLQVNLLSSEDATRLGLQRALNIAADRLQEILNNPQLMTAKEAVDLLFKAMKAQDSRVNAISKIKDGHRAQSDYQRAFNEACYGRGQE